MVFSFNAEGYLIPMSQIQVQQEAQGLPITFNIMENSTLGVISCQQARTVAGDLRSVSSIFYADCAEKGDRHVDPSIGTGPNNEAAKPGFL